MEKKLNILVYSGGEVIGDALYKLNFFDYLRNCYPNSNITLVAGEGSSEYSSNLKIFGDKLFNNIRENIRFFSKNFFLIKYFNPCPLKKKYDVVIDTQSDYRTTLLLKKIKTDIFISYSINWFFSDLKPKNKKIHSLNDRLLKMVDLLNHFYKINKVSKKEFSIVLPKNYDQKSRQVLSSRKKYFGIAPGAGDPRKIWPLDNFIKVVRIFGHEYTPVFFLGPSEKNLEKKLKKIFPSSIFPNTTSFRQDNISGPLFVISLARRLDFCLSNDSGVGHMFAHAKIPQLLIYSLGNPKKYKPLNENTIIVDSKKWRSKSPKVIPVDYVVSKIKFLINKNKQFY